MKKLNFNHDWLFANAKASSEQIKVHLPHDAMQTEKRLPRLKDGSASGFFPGGKYIYTKEFFGEKQFESKTLVLEFDGVYQKSIVSINNSVVGGHLYGYSRFYVDITNQVKIGEVNEIKVVVNNTQTPNSRWYTGSGIYRDVKLLVGGKSYLPPEGVYITTKSIQPAVIHVQIDSYKAKNCDVHVEVLDGNQIVAESDGFDCNITVPGAKLWDAQHPNLYNVRVTLSNNGAVVDETLEHIGIRKLEWNAERGMLVNGESVKLRGGCIHHDNGPLGACEFRKAAYRRIKIMKQAGYNAIRSAHNPASSALLEACDTLGMYVMDETFDMWRISKNQYDYAMHFEDEWEKDVAAMIARDFNHPSVIMYSVGNEIPDIDKESGIKLNKKMVDFCHKLDSSRPVTNGVNSMGTLFAPTPEAKEKPIRKANPNDIVDPYREEKDEKATGSKFINMMVTLMPFLIEKLVSAKKANQNLHTLMHDLDIMGFNYGHLISENLHGIDPELLLVNTETFPKDIAHNWDMVMRNPYLVGDFMWTAWDYMGETGIGLVEYGKKKGQFSKPYPCLSGGIGAIDMTGFIEAQGYIAAVAFDSYRKPYIGVRPVNHSGEPYSMGQWRGTDVRNSWAWDGCEGKKAQIEVYSVGESVELFLNGKSIETKPLERNQAKFETFYVQGTIEVVSYDKQKNEIARSALKSASVQTMLTVEPEETTIFADGEDLAFIQFLITDENGVLKMLADTKVTVEVTGAGTLAAIGSGNPVTTESFTSNGYTTYFGRGIAIVRSNGEKGNIKITFSADGMRSKTVLLNAE